LEVGVRPPFLLSALFCAIAAVEGQKQTGSIEKVNAAATSHLDNCSKSCGSSTFYGNRGQQKAGEFMSLSTDDTFPRPAVDELKHKSVRGGLVTVGTQGAKLVLQSATLILLARLLSVEDFGVQGMAAVLTGFLGVFMDAGLSTATIQRLDVTKAQVSTLFWINVVAGVVLATFSAALAPALVAFYHEPRLFWIAVVSGLAFVFSGLAAQHQALILREMRFLTSAKIELLSLATGSVAAVVMALLGFHYWALVSMPIIVSLANVAGVWLANPWLPGLPHRQSGVLPMLRFGWLATCSNLLVFLAWNTDNMLVGRYWGADGLGLYGRAYTLATLPVNQLTTASSVVAFSALSRIQNDADRFAKSFLRGYSLLLSITMPVIICCALFSEEIVHVLLGPKWTEVGPILRLLTPAGLVFALANPFSWLVVSTGRMGRSLGMGMTTTPVVIVGIILGLSHGPKGVALGYSSAMMLIILPIMAWSKLGTRVTWEDLWRTTKPLLLSSLSAGAIGLIVKIALNGAITPILHLLLGVGLVFGVYAWALLIAMGQKNLYIDLWAHAFRGIRPNR
jgi:O-antigen/teichoic acid export membrane protein